MKYRRFEPLDRDLSVLVLGTAYIADHPEQESFALLDAWVEAGGNVVDCARQYGDGECERMLGRWLRDRDLHHEVAVISKSCHHVSHGIHHEPDKKRVTPEYLASDLEESLEALGVDSVDIHFLHRDDLAKPVGPLVEALNEHRRAGRIDVFGASNWTPRRLDEAAAYAASNGLDTFACSSPGLSLAEPAGEPWANTVFAGDPDSREWYERKRLPIFAWSSQAGGFFVGLRNPEIERVYVTEGNLERLRRADELGRAKGASANDVALAWVLHQPFPTHAIIGPQTTDELHDSLAALDVELTLDEVGWLSYDEEER
jgi:1-deoxyxylulose-5-phosphate synthase